jgi:hypothetical protein
MSEPTKAGKKDEVYVSSLANIPLLQAAKPEHQVPLAEQTLERRMKQFEDRMMTMVESKLAQLAVASLPKVTLPAEEKEAKKSKPKKDKLQTAKKQAKSGISLDTLVDALRDHEDHEEEPKEEGAVGGESDSEDDSPEDPVNAVAQQRGFANLTDKDLIISFAEVVRENGSVQVWVEKHPWKQRRSFREAMALSRIIDAML